MGQVKRYFNLFILQVQKVIIQLSLNVDCYVLDLRQDTWTWDTSFVPAMPTKMNRLCLEYNKKTHELWQFGGEIGYNSNTKDVSSLQMFQTIKLSISF